MKAITRLFLLSLTAALSFGASLFELESTYLGDGWFRYRVKAVPDQFFHELELTSFGLPFTNRTDYGELPAKWISESSLPHRADWIYDSFDPQLQPYEAVFTARSSETGFRTINAKVLGYSFTYNSGTPGAADVTGAGLADFPVLVPCPPAQADNSPTNRVSGFEALPSLRIQKLEMTGGNVNGITFSGSGDFTVRLQATTNLSDWREVAYLFGSGSSTTWTTNQPLNPLGNFFRLELVGQGHIPRAN